MADLSTRLPSEIDSAQRFVNPAPATPSIFGAIADFGAGVAQVADKAWTELDKNARENAASKRQAGVDQAQNDSIKRIASGILSDPSAAPQPNIPPESVGAYNNSKPLAQSAANTQAAAGQGKIDPSMAQARSLAVFRQALAANPGHEYAVFQAFKEMGVDNMMMQQYKNAENSIEADQTAEQDRTNAIKKTAVTKYGYTDFDQRSPQEQAQIMATVGSLEAKEADLDTKTKLADLTLKNVQLTNEQRTQLQTQGSSSLFDSANTYLTGQFSNVSKMMINMLGDPNLASQPGRLEQLQSHFMNVALPSLDLQYQNKKAQLGSLLTPEDATRLDDTFKQQRSALVDMISGPQSVVESNKRVLQNITDTYGIDYAKSAPTLMRLQKLIGPQAVGVLLSPSITGNKPLMDMLGKELNGVISDPSKMPSFTEFVQTLNGSVDPSTWDPEKQRAMAPAALASVRALATDQVSINGTDKQGHQALVNAVKNFSGVAVDVVPQWGFGNVLAQGKALNNKGVYIPLFNTSANPDDRTQAIRSWIPANTRTYETLSGMNSGDQYYSVRLDPHTLQWSAVWNGQLAQQNIGQGMSIANGKPQPSTKVLEQAATLNHMLNNLSDAAAKGYDDVLGKGVNYNEARRYFATGEQPQSLKNPAKGKNGKTPEQNIDDSISHMLDFVNTLPNPTNPTAPVKAKTIGPSPLAPAIGASAEKYNVPPAIAASLFNTETSGGKNHHDSSKGAVGPGQVMPATAAAYGVSDLHSLKDEDNVDLALHVLSDNYKKTGNWSDALSMYHSGHDLKTAIAHNMTDGHMRTADYVASTMEAASSISPENLARYGYVRR